MELQDLKAGDYVFFYPQNQAILITPTYEDGNIYTCSLEALSLYPHSYRIATDKEIEIGIQIKKDWMVNAKKMWDKLLKNEDGTWK